MRKLVGLVTMIACAACGEDPPYVLGEGPPCPALGAACDEPSGTATAAGSG